jgi:limonene-1,2-epoxide hydrolase
MKRNIVLLVIVLLTATSLVAAQDVTPVPPADATQILPTLDPLMQPTTDPAQLQPTTDPALQPTTDAAQVQPTTDPAGTIIYVGDPNQESVQVVMSYLQTRDPQLLSDEAEFFDITTGQPTVGREAITQMQNDFFGQAFTGTLLQPVTVIAADTGYVVVEFTFAGSNTGAFRNNPATNFPVSVPMVGIFQVENGQIVNGRLYYDAATIETQLGLTTAVQPGAAVALTPSEVAGVEPTPGLAQEPVANPAQELDVVLDDPAAFYGQTVTVEGNVFELMNERLFRISDFDLIDPDELLILHSTDGDLSLQQDARVQITGMVQPFILTDIESQFGFDLDDALFVGFENQPVLIAESVTPMP